MRRFLTCSAVLLAVVICACELLAGRPSESPVGIWQVEIKNNDHGLAVVTFAVDGTLSGYAITMQGAGPFTITGDWGYNAKGEMVASFIQHINGNNVAASISTRVKNGKFNAHGKSTTGQFRWKGVLATEYPDISGNWVFELKLGHDTYFENVALSASTNMPSVFTIAGQGTGPNGVYPVSGAIIVNERNRAEGISVSDFGPGNISSNSFSGRFKKKLDEGKFKGENNSNQPVHLRATKS